jgi:oligopeptide/dipeptide ABC transporter ATP-binding protein
MTQPALFSVRNLTVTYQTRKGPLRALDDVSFSISSGEALALVGESGSGKSTIALAAMGLLGPEAAVSGGIFFNGRDLTQLSRGEQRNIRGQSISIVFQDPFTSLNPSLPIGLQVAEPLMQHRQMPRDAAIARAVETLAEVGLPHPQQLIHAYPHQLSGGMQQRVLIASALICDPALVVLDEPTTALDVTVEAHILELLDEIRRLRKIGMLFITHNLGIVNRIADRVCVVYAGRIVEVGSKADVLGEPLHPYTKGLLASLPRLSSHDRQRRLSPIGGQFPDLTALPDGCVFAPRCPFAESRCREPQALKSERDDHAARCWKADGLRRIPWPIAIASGTPQQATSRPSDLKVSNLSKFYNVNTRGLAFGWVRRFGLPWPKFTHPKLRAVNGVSFAIASGETLGLVGESGSGKSTTARLTIRLIEPDGGEIVFNDKAVNRLRGKELSAFRGAAQIIFQNPDSSLNPSRTVGEAVARAAKLHTKTPRDDMRRHVEQLLERVGLPHGYYDRYPHQMSGGERQRVGIARALGTEPSLIVCDEPVSALDVSVQATILNLLADLRDQFKLSYLFISHDLSVVSHIAGRIAVMYAGEIVEMGPTAAVLEPPYHPYTEALLSAIPLPDPNLTKPHRIVLKSDVTGMSPDIGCPFHRRCPRKLGAICETVTPPTINVTSDHIIGCHIPLAELRKVSSVITQEPVQAHA